MLSHDNMIWDVAVMNIECGFKKASCFPNYSSRLYVFAFRMSSIFRIISVCIN